MNFAERTIDIKKRMDAANVHPDAVIFHKQVSSKELRQSLMRLGESVLEQGFGEQAPYKAALELLLRRPSPLTGENGELQQAGETTVEAACRLAVNLDSHVLAIQGPPGTGKTWTGAHIICALKEAGLKVGVTAVSHKVIENLLEAAMKEARKQGIALHAVHRQEGAYEGDWGIVHNKDYDALLHGLANGDIDVLGGTAWCWARPGFQQAVDVLIIDEAGQMSLANVLAAAPAGRGLILLGDPQQLEQPLQSSHPEGSEVSALYHLLNGEETMPANKGLFLSDTFRLHPDIGRFTSETYYEGRVRSVPGLENQAILPQPGKTLTVQGAGLRYVPVEHAGNHGAKSRRGRGDRGPRARAARERCLAGQGRQHCAAQREGHPHRRALQRAGGNAQRSDTGARQTGSAPSTSSRGRRRQS